MQAAASRLALATKLQAREGQRLARLRSEPEPAAVDVPGLRAAIEGARGAGLAASDVAAAQDKLARFERWQQADAALAAAMAPEPEAADIRALQAALAEATAVGLPARRAWRGSHWPRRRRPSGAAAAEAQRRRRGSTRRCLPLRRSDPARLCRALEVAGGSWRPRRS